MATADSHHAALSPLSGQFKKPLLYVLVGSVIVGALLGIVVVLRGEWGWYEIRVILTTVTLAVASLCGLACDLSRTPRGANLLPTAGLVLTAIAASLILLGMWSEMHSQEYWKTTASAAILCVATVHVCLLSLAQLARKYRWVYALAFQVVFGLAALLIFVIVGEVHEEPMFRIVVTVAIVDTALTLIIPLLHRLSRAEAGGLAFQTPMEQRSLAAIDEEIARLEARIAALEKMKVTLTKSRI